MALRTITPIALCAAMLLGSVATGVAANNTNDESVSGQLQVAGRGSVDLDGAFVSFGLVVRGSGTMRLVDRDGDASVSVDGARIRTRTGRTTQVKLRNGKRFYLTGSRFRVTISGRAYAINASGIGRATLSGAGVYVPNGGDAVTWRGRRVLQLGVSDRRSATRPQRGKNGAGAARGQAEKRRAEQARKRAQEARRRARKARERAQEAKRSRLSGTDTGAGAAPLTTVAASRPV